MITGQPTDEIRREDAELARAAASGDRAAFAAIYDRYADRLHDFCVGMLRDRDAAADCVQDVFLTAATRLSQLHEPERLRSWLYAIARNQAVNLIHARRREQPSEELPEMPSAQPDLETLAARSELAELISEACGGLSDRDRTVLELAYRHGLDGPELAAALGVSHTNANTLMGRLRDSVERSLGALLVCRRGRANPNDCAELTALLEGWDGRFTVLMRKRVARHIDNCRNCEDERRRMVSPVALLAGAPVFIPAPAWLRDHTLGQIQLTSASTPLTGGNATTTAHAPGASESWWPPDSFDTADLTDPGKPTRPPQTGSTPTGQGPHPDLAPRPPTPPQTSTTDSEEGQSAGRGRTALLVALVLLALGIVAVLSSLLLRQLSTSTVPASTNTPAPAATSLPTSSTPASTAPPPPSSESPAPPPPTSLPAPTTRVRTTAAPTATLAQPPIAGPTTPSPQAPPPAAPLPSRPISPGSPPFNSHVPGPGPQGGNGSAPPSGPAAPTCQFGTHCPTH